MKCHGSVPLIHVFLLKDIGGLRRPSTSSGGGIILTKESGVNIPLTYLVVGCMVCLALEYCFSIYSKVETMEEYEIMVEDLHQR
jgi:hypothetical protein